MKRTWNIVITILILAFVWIQSALPVSLSAAESSLLMENVINPILQSIGMDAMGHNLVRKLAHVTEFFAFSVFVTLSWSGNVFRAFLSGFVVAFLDESIQILSNRGSQISDVWIDLIGITAGVAIGCLIWWFGKSNHGNKLRKKN